MGMAARRPLAARPMGQRFESRSTLLDQLQDCKDSLGRPVRNRLHLGAFGEVRRLPELRKGENTVHELACSIFVIALA
jgi:hypothetical protein